MVASDQALLVAATLYTFRDKKGEEDKKRSGTRKVVQKTTQPPNRVQMGTQKEVLKHDNGNILKCRVLVRRLQANNKFTGFCKSVWFSQILILASRYMETRTVVYIFFLWDPGQSLSCLIGIKILPSQKKRQA